MRVFGLGLTFLVFSVARLQSHNISRCQSPQIPTDLVYDCLLVVNIFGITFVDTASSDMPVRRHNNGTGHGHLTNLDHKQKTAISQGGP